MSLFGSRISTFFGSGSSGGGGGGSFNPTINYMPFKQSASAWGDSYWVFDPDYVATTENAGSGGLYGFAHVPTSFQQKVGDFANIIKGDYLVIDNALESIKTYMSNTEWGIFIDRTQRAYFGDYTDNNKWTLLIDNTSLNSITTNFGGNLAGLNLDASANNTYQLVGEGGNGSFGVYSNTNEVKIKNQSGVGFYSSSAITQLGDFDGQFNATFIQVDSNNRTIASVFNSNVGQGIWLDDSNSNYLFGDTFNTAGGFKIWVQDYNHISFCVNTIEAGIYVNANVDTWIGDFNGISTSIFLKVDNSNDLIFTQKSNLSNIPIGLYLDFGNLEFYIGDPQSASNSTFFGVDDSNQRLMASNNLRTSTQNGSSGQYLKINVGGNDYVIELRNP